MYHFQTNLTVPVGRWGDKLIKLTRFTVAIHFDVLPVLDYGYIYMYIYVYLVGGLEHFLFTHILGIIIPTDFHIFQRGWNHQPDINRSIGFTLYPTKELWLLARWAHQQVFQQNIFDHLGWLKPYKQWDPINNGINHLSTGAGFLPSTVRFVSLWKKTWKGAEIWCHDWTGWHLSTSDEKRILFQAAVSSSNSKKC